MFDHGSGVYIQIWRVKERVKECDACDCCRVVELSEMIDYKFGTNFMLFAMLLLLFKSLSAMKKSWKNYGT